jgi:hypothetical protein
MIWASSIHHPSSELMSLIYKLICIGECKGIYVMCRLNKWTPNVIKIGFQVLMVVSMKIVFWSVVPYSLVEAEISEVLAAPIFRALMVETASTSETSVNFYQSAQCYNPEDGHLHN